MMLAAPVLTGTHVQLEPLRSEHVDGLLAAATERRDTYGWTPVPGTLDEMQRYVEGRIADHRNGDTVSLVQRRVADGALVGCTRFMRFEAWRGRMLDGAAVPDEVEVGGTWLAASAQRTPINTEAKLLLCQHAFETWEVCRVALCTDARNERSRAAIMRIGARFEGVLRSHRGSFVAGEEGQPRDSAMFAIAAADWPAVKAQLLGKLRAAG